MKSCKKYNIVHVTVINIINKMCDLEPFSEIRSQIHLVRSLQCSGTVLLSYHNQTGAVNFEFSFNHCSTIDCMVQRVSQSI